MKKALQALSPAIIAHIFWLFISRPPINIQLWLAIIGGVLILGGVLTARLLINYMQEANVERGSMLKIGIGAVVVILYVVIFSFTGGALGVAVGG